MENIKNGIKEIFVKNGFDATHITIDEHNTYTSVKSESTVFMTYKLTGKKMYAAFNNQFKDLFTNYQTETIPSDKLHFRVIISGPNDILSLENQLIEIYSSLFRSGYDCCSRYLECSNAKKCINPNQKHALKCTYRRSLLNGKIFYGVNRNV